MLNMPGTFENFKIRFLRTSYTLGPIRLDQKWTRFVYYVFKNFQRKSVPGMSGPKCDQRSRHTWSPLLSMFHAYLVSFITDVPCIPSPPDMSATNQSNRDRYDSYHMSETRGVPLRLLWLRRLNQSLHRYDWDAQKICSRFSILHTWDCNTLKNNDQKILGRLSHICASLGQGVSVILVSTVSLASQSYHCKLWFKRLTYISLSSTSRVSLIQVRSHVNCRPSCVKNEQCNNIFSHVIMVF